MIMVEPLSLPLWRLAGLISSFTLRLCLRLQAVSQSSCGSFFRPYGCPVQASSRAAERRSPDSQRGVTPRPTGSTGSGGNTSSDGGRPSRTSSDAAVRGPAAKGGFGRKGSAGAKAKSSAPVAKRWN